MAQLDLHLVRLIRISIFSKKTLRTEDRRLLWSPLVSSGPVGGKSSWEAPQGWGGGLVGDTGHRRRDSECFQTSSGLLTISGDSTVISERKVQRTLPATASPYLQLCLEALCFWCAALPAARGRYLSGELERQGSLTIQLEIEILNFEILLLFFLPVQPGLWTTYIPVTFLYWTHALEAYHHWWAQALWGHPPDMGCLRLALLALCSPQSTFIFTDLIISTNGKPDTGHTSCGVTVRFVVMVEASKEHFHPLKVLVGCWGRQHRKAPSQT